jgi:hypothetical protein
VGETRVGATAEAAAVAAGMAVVTAAVDTARGLETTGLVGPLVCDGRALEIDICSEGRDDCSALGLLRRFYMID